MTRPKFVVLAIICVALVGLVSSQSPAGDITAGLFSEYTFDTGANDSVGSNNGMLTNGAAIVSDPVRGNVLSLDGVDDYVSLPSANMASGRSELTLTMWIRPDTWSGTNTIYDEYGGDYGAYWQFSILGGYYTRDSSTGPMGSRDNDLSMPAVPTGEWHHMAFVYSVSQSTKAIYYDGALYASTSNSVNTLTSDRAGARFGFPCDGTYYAGLIDDARFYDRALTAGEIAQLAAQATYTLTVNSGVGDGDYPAGLGVSISADAPPSGMGFSVWVGDTAGIANVHAPDTTITMPAGDAEITATYASPYNLTVNSGAGSGAYAAGAVVGISADAGPSGYIFDQWLGDTAAVTDTGAASTTVTMPAGDVTVTADYTEYVGYYLTVNSGSGSGGYDEGAVVAVNADTPPSGQTFNMWIGDLDGFADVDAKTSASSTYTMPAGSAAITATYVDIGLPKNWWPAFDVFCKAKFGAEAEHLVYDTFGTTLQLVDSGEWSYASKSSATVAFQTNLPAVSYVEYGQTTAYGSQAQGAWSSDRYLYTHIFHLTGLAEATTYHYRLVATDERGNIIYSPDKTFTTATPANVVYIPAEVSGPPYELNQAGKTYLLTEDMVIDGKAFDVIAANVTLDLGGHTVVYNNAHNGPISGDFWAYIDNSWFGIRAMNADGMKVYNGTIKQGAGADAAESSSIGFNPIYTKGTTGMEIAGVSIQYCGPQQVGIYNHWGGSNSQFHHNVFLDTATELINRHGAGCRSILMYGSSYSGIETYNNLVLRTRQSGVSGNLVHDNEIYQDSWTTNSFGVKVEAGGEAYGNKIFGTGYHVIAFGWTSDLEYHHNFVHLEGERPDGRFAEFGDQISLNGFRLTQYGGSTKSYQNNLYHDNVVIVTAKGQSECRGVQFFSDPYVGNLVFRDNIVKALVRDDQAHQAACVVTQGLTDRTETQLPIIYEDNTFISNICNIRFGDYYGTGSNHRFYNCTFVRVGDNGLYKTFLWDSPYACKYHVVRDATFEGGASLNSISFGSGDHSMTVEWTLTVETDPNADVTIRDVNNQVVFTGNSGPGGSVSTPLAQYLAAASGNTYYTPHSVTVEKAGSSNTVAVTVDAKKTIQVWLGPSYTLTVNSGSGSGSYTAATVVAISADAAPSGQVFDAWVGDTSGVADTAAASTTYTMPAADAELTATYGDIPYTLSVTNGSGSGDYAAGTVVAISADAAPSGKLFAIWVGDTGYVADTSAASTTVTMPAAAVSVTAAYTWGYQLTVNSGTGDGLYADGAVVDIEADAAPSGQVFAAWVGDTAGVADTSAATTTYTMSASAAEITATYASAAIPGDLDGSGFVGQGDLDIVLDQWGHGSPPNAPITDPRADASGDGFVGQDDLDIVLDHWGQGQP